MKTLENTFEIPLLGRFANPRMDKMARFMGKRTLFWLGVSFFASLTLTLVEFFIAGTIQLLLLSMGLLDKGVKLFGPLASLSPDPLHLCFLLLGIGITRSLAQFFVLQSGIVAYENVSARLRLAALSEVLLDKSREFIASSKINTRLSEIFPKAANSCQYFFTFFTNAVQGVGFLTLMFFTAWRETIVTLFGLGFLGLAVIATNRKIQKIASRVPAEQEQLLAGIQRIVRNLFLVRVLRTESQEQERLSKNIMEYSALNLRAVYWINFTSALTPFFGIILVVVLIMLTTSSWDTPGVRFVAFLYILIRFVQVLSAGVNALTIIYSYAPQLKEAVKYLTSFEQGEFAHSLRPADSLVFTGKVRKSYLLSHAATVPSLQNSSLRPPAIEVNKVSFTYPNTDLLVLNKVELSVPGGGQVGIVGPSGSGKSTLLAMILGIFKPSHGQVLIGGDAPDSFFAKAVGKVGYVGPEPFLIDGSLRDNLLYGTSGTISTERVDKALKLSRIDELVRDLPGGLDYKLTENGDGLSAGQKQRLSLARALLLEPVLLILDEASANLDEGTEAEIAESIKGLKQICTVIVVSHRPGMLRYSDAVLKLVPV